MRDLTNQGKSITVSQKICHCPAANGNLCQLKSPSNISIGGAFAQSGTTLKIQILAKIINNNEEENFLDGNGVISLTAVLNLPIQSNFVFVFSFKNAKYEVYAGKIPKIQYVVFPQKSKICCFVSKTVKYVIFLM